MLEIIKKLTIITPAIIIYIRTIHSIFIEVIKSKYSKSPGEGSIFNIIISIMGYMMVGIEIVYVLFIIIQLLIGGGQYNPFSIPEISFKFSDFLAVALAIIFIFVCFSVPSNFMVVLSMFKDKLEKGNIDNSRRSYIRIIYLNFILLILSTGVFGLMFISIWYGNSSKESLLTISTILIFNLTMITILHSIYKSFKDIYDNRIYILEGENLFITCKFYLAYSDYFLIISDKEEKFISKSKIGIVRKIEVSNEHLNLLDK
jgi:hypothetical protein